ncbi:MAG: type II toxin-antitoxin system VapC family toxin [Ignavibacteriales bacterium]
MAGLIIDSSFFVALTVAEEYSAFAEETVASLASADFEAPALIVWEVANVLEKKVRQRQLSNEDRLIMLGRFDELPILLHAAPDAEHLRRLAGLCDQHKLSAYDAAYLGLALNGGSALATLDRRLTHAARAEGVTVHSPF